MNYLNKEGQLEHALMAVLYAAENEGCNLDKLLQRIKQDIVGDNAIRPPPQDQDAVLTVIAQAISDVKND